jgi:hypothetical protein
MPEEIQGLILPEDAGREADLVGSGSGKNHPGDKEKTYSFN